MAHDPRLVERQETAIRRDREGCLCIALIGGEEGLMTSMGIWLYPLVKAEGEPRPTLNELVGFLSEQPLVRENFRRGDKIRVYIKGMSGFWIWKFVLELEHSLTQLLCPNGEPHSQVEFREWPI